MPETPVRYRKLPGRRFRLTGITRLWEGGDHLIVVSPSFGTERYRRFYFRDIQAVVLQRTSSRLTWNCIFGSFAGLACAGAGGLLQAAQTASPSDRDVFIVFGTIVGTFAALFLLGLLINTLRGGTCRVFIQTAVRQEELGAPGRLPAARGLINRLTPLIEAAQSAPAGVPAPAAVPIA